MDLHKKKPSKQVGTTKQITPKEGISTLIGKNQSVLIKMLGQPSRIDPTTYDYDWWIYNQDDQKYVQIGVENGKVVTVFAIGDQTSAAPFKIGQAIDEIYTHLFFTTEVNFNHAGSSYRFELSEEDMNIRPLVKLGNIYAQLYFDKFTSTLSSVRFMNAATLIKQRPYELVYRGNLQEPAPVSEEKMLLVEKGSEQQIFDVTNIIRQRHQLRPLKWDEATAQVALGHSKDMYESQYFSHTSKKFGDLSKRLETANVPFKLAGENIAANYVDGLAAVEGWLNSKGHRDAMLNSEFTHLGVGVYQKYYTQNYIQRWEE